MTTSEERCRCGAAYGMAPGQWEDLERIDARLREVSGLVGKVTRLSGLPDETLVLLSEKFRLLNERQRLMIKVIGSHWVCAYEAGSKEP